MSASIIDGKEMAKQTRIQLKKEITKLLEAGKKAPGLTVILVGEDPASQIYVRNKEKFAKRVGIVSDVIRLPKETKQEELLELIQSLNENNDVHGILVQMPLPKHMDEAEVLRTIDEKKDVDGFHVMNAGKLFIGQEALEACTPKGIIKLIESTGVPIEGKHAVVVGRSNIVGKPVAMMLLSRNATVTMCHSRTKDLAGMVKQADIVVAAVGRANLITKDMVKDGAIVIDVGMNRVDEKLYGDVEFEGVKEVASHITPVPGGVGPMTISMLLSNTLEAYKRYGQ